MKRMNHLWKLSLLSGMMALTFGCSDSGAEVSLPDTDWDVSVSRAVTGGDHVTIALRYGTTTSMATLVPAETEGGTATWLNDEKPTWPGDNTTSVEAIAFSPTVTALPETVSATDGKAWLMDYQFCTSGSKPTSFEMTHLMAQLEVHIRLHDDDEHHYEPSEAVIGLCTTATIDYANKQLTDPATKDETFSLGTFDREDKTYGSDENWVNTAQLVIPQTLEADTPCLSFKAGDKTYTFTPEEAIVLKPGKKTKLYLGAAYENACITLAEEGVTVTDWETGETYNENVFTPDN